MVWAWEVERLWEITRSYPSKRVPIGSIHDFDLVCWFDGERYTPTCRAVAGHARKIMEAEFEHPVILSAKGHVMDGMHRIAKAWLLGQAFIEAVQFEEDPEPDERIHLGMTQTAITEALL